jgi:hypothetical protein
VDAPPASLGMMCNWSTHVIAVRVEKVDRDKGIVVWRKVSECKGKWPGGDVVRHDLAALPEPTRRAVLQWAEVGKTTVVFALESYRWCHTYVDGTWYASSSGDWQTWTGSRVEPAVLRSYCGRAGKLPAAATAILGGQEVVVPCLADAPPPGNGTRKVQRLRASLKLLTLDARRDFVGWGGDDFTPVLGMPGFSQSSALPSVGADAQAISVADWDGDGKPDVCLAGAGRVCLVQNAGDSLLEVIVPGLGGGCRAAVWADYNGDGRPDLLLATPSGPRLFTNLGAGSFRDDSALLPRQPGWDLTAAAWIDQDGDGKPDILLANGYFGLLLFRNKGKAEAPPGAPPTPPAKPGQPPGPPQPLWFEDVSAKVGLGPDGVGSGAKGDALAVCDVDGDGRPDFLYAAGTGILALNTPDGFREVKDSGIGFKAGKVGPVFGDYDGDGRPDLFVPQDGTCKLFHNDGKGHFTDVTAKSGDLAKEVGATCAAWGDLDGDGTLDLVVGCLRGPNRFFRNKGDGTFEDATEVVGLHKHVYNTQAVALVDVNHDGVLDVVFNNEGQDSVLLLGDAARPRKRTPLTVTVAGKDGLTGCRVSVVGPGGKEVAARELGGGEGRGGQAAAQATFSLEPGTYQLEVRYSSGQKRNQEVTVGRTPAWESLGDR